MGFMLSSSEGYVYGWDQPVAARTPGPAHLHPKAQETLFEDSNAHVLASEEEWFEGGV